MSTYSPRELERINGDMMFWKQLEHCQWCLVSFTDRTRARFGWAYNGTFTKYVKVEANSIHFLSGVAPDVLDQLSDSSIVRASEITG